MSGGRRRLDPAVRREELLEKGLELFGRFDYHALSSKDLSRHTGVSRALLHHYFGDKRGFYLASIDRAAADMLQRIEPDRSRPEPERTRHGLRCFVEYTRDNATGWAALLRSGFAADPAFGERVEGVRAVIVDRVLKSARVDPARPIFRMVVRAWLAEIESLCLSWLDAEALPLEELVEMMMRSRDAALRNAASADPEAAADLDAAGVSARELP